MSRIRVIAVSKVWGSTRAVDAVTPTAEAGTDLPPERERRLRRAVALLGIEPLLDRKPEQVSGGQQHRVALGRAIVAETPVCLMDEPLPNLDADGRGGTDPVAVASPGPLSPPAPRRWPIRSRTMTSVLHRIVLAGVAGAVLMLSAGAAFAATELNMYYPVAVGGPITRLIDGMIAEFEKAHPGIKVKAVYAGNYDDTRTKALAALKGGQPVQLSVLFSIDLFELIDQDVILPFDDLTGAEDRAWLESFYPALMENSRTGGKIWGIPFQRSTIVLYWNKDAFKEAGLDPNRPPATWADMVDMGKKLVKRDGGNVTRYGIMVPSTGYPYWMFQAFALQNGEVLMNQDGNRTFFDKPAVVEALEFWRDLGAKHGILPRGTVEWGTLRAAFLEGKTGMMWHTTGNLTPVRKEAKFDFGVAMLPANKRRGSPTGGGNFYIFRKTSPEERKAALAFIKWMTAPERAAQWSIETGYVGVTRASYETPALRKYIAEFPAAAVARDQFQHATAEFSVHENARVKKLLDDAIQAVLTGGKEPKAALAEAQAGADRVLGRYRR